MKQKSKVSLASPFTLLEFINSVSNRFSFSCLNKTYYPWVLELSYFVLIPPNKTKLEKISTRLKATRLYRRQMKAEAAGKGMNMSGTALGTTSPPHYLELSELI